MTDQNVDGSWAVIQAQLDGRLAWLRLRNDIDGSTIDSNPHRLAIRWDYEDDGDEGMPPIELRERFRALEDALVSSIQTGDAGILSLVLTTAGSREWHVHFSDSEAAQGSVNNAFADLPDMPISLSGKIDPDWSEYTYFRSNLADD